MKIKTIDVLVLGGGSTGQIAAYRAKAAGKGVVLIETGPPGGTCANRGCDAKKPLVNAVARLRQSQAMVGLGLTEAPSIDWPALMKFKRSFTDPIPDNTREDLKEAGIELIEAQPRFVSADTVEVDGRRLQASQILISTGQRPRTLKLPRGGEEYCITSDDFLELDHLPKRVVFVGGGYVAMEFASVAAAAGADVTVLESSQYPLTPFDQDLVRGLLAALHDQGVKVLTRRQVFGIEQTDNALFVHCENQDSPTEADLVINSTGRVPSIDGLDLDEVGIAHSDAGISVDDYLRSTSHDHIWAGGDVADTGRPPLTPTSSEDGQVVAHNLLHPDKRKSSDTAVATVCFTYPPIAGVGLTEAAAREKLGDDIEVVSGDMSQWKQYREQNEQHARYKLIFDRDQKLVGAHLFGADCEEVINMFAMAIGQGCSKIRFSETTMAYPTAGFSLQSVLVKQQG